MNKASERTKKWIKEHPEQAKSHKTKSTERKLRLRDEALRVIKRAKHKTPSKAIRAYCNSCPNGVSRSGFSYAPVECKKKRCPLFPFRNGIPHRIKIALKTSLQRISEMRDARKKENNKCHLL